eukprot:comp13549_c0_seq1/m.18855 comp13549_c0_seq1/g.18855  ORF comp13549_c0_seq1/g.18855 comp13549_c0_seq1/m.18855 type:complete len:203 (-) comp13549_c0_seq1:59-667(-)
MTKGVSAEEKRTRLLEIFTESADFFQLKDLEKIAPKQKGIIVQSVKDVLQSLVDDNLVTSDRIATSNFFWALPSNMAMKRKQRIEDLEDKKEVLKKQKKMLEDGKKAHQEEKEEEGRAEIVSKNIELKEKYQKLKDRLSELNAVDHETYEKIIKDTKIAKDAANRWTDNIFTTKSWISNKFNIDSSTIDQQFGIPDDLDYVN